MVVGRADLSFLCALLFTACSLLAFLLACMGCVDIISDYDRFLLQAFLALQRATLNALWIL